MQTVWGNQLDDVYLVGTDTVFHYNGTTWKMMDPPRVTPNSIAYLEDVWGSGASDIYAVGEDYVAEDIDHYKFTAVIWHYDGARWQLLRSGPSRTTRMGRTAFCVWGSSARDVFVLMNVSQQYSFVLHYDGTSWSPMATGSEPRLTAIWGSNRADVFAVGFGTIRHYDGVTWEPMDAERLGSLFAVWGSNSTDVYAVGHPGVVLHYDGTRWRSVDAKFGTSTLWSVWGSGPHDVFVAGDTVMHYDGTGWRQVNVPKQSQYWHVWGSDSRNFYLWEADSILKYQGGGDGDR